ncbi:hypothetical protein QNI16_21685 [Cytophagaceae bacterium YF14B1]|uniref:Uncharacterized protein n=1 Tax=Xanthocytophaga flava TaxID=3048013 RepID=A0AAE3QTE6_9BACT|nr:hypothetical protein [Xanthocytophaga flavus]MDJ1483125.1 hypothetical protein [Xanthocytophaga flavus]
MDLKQRIEKIRAQQEEFRLTNKVISEYSGISLTTVMKTLSKTEADKRYLTEGNVLAIEKGMGKVLDEYRAKLCGSQKKA